MPPVAIATADILPATMVGVKVAPVPRCVSPNGAFHVAVTALASEKVPLTWVTVPSVPYSWSGYTPVTTPLSSLGIAVAVAAPSLKVTVMVWSRATVEGV